MRLRLLQPRPAREPIVRSLDPRFEQLVPPGAVLDKIADDHLFSDVVKNTIYRLCSAGSTSAETSGT